MATIAENLLELQQTKDNFKTAFAGVGVDVTNTPFTEYPNKFGEIQTGGGEENELVGVFDGTLEEFDNKKLGFTSLAPRRFDGFANLKSADFTGINIIPDYTCNGCINLENVTFDEGITNVGTNAFYNGVPETLKGNFGKVGASAFYVSQSNLQEKTKTIDISVNGDISDYAFYNNYGVNSLKISKESIITSLGQYCFRCIGASRPNPENNVFDLDFSNSTFTSIPQYCFGGANSSTSVRYCNIIFPATITSIANYAFSYSKNLTLYFKRLVPPTLSSSFSNATNHKIFVPYNSVNAYKTATNWTAQASRIYGFADKDFFEQGQSLPKYSPEGFELTWYSDKELTTQVTTADNPSEFYYCTIGTQVSVVGIDRVVSVDCDISIVDSNGTHYKQDYGVPVGTELTITITPKDNYSVYYATLNGTDITSPYTYTTVSGENIEVLASCWDGQNIPPIPVFSLNDWATIKKVVQDGNASKYWVVGDTKPLQIGDFVYTVRLADLQKGRYDYSSGERKTNAVFEFVELWNDNSSQSGMNTGGWAGSKLRTTINTTVLEQFPIELSSILEDVQIGSANGVKAYYTGISYSNNKLFIPCAKEINLSTNYDDENEGTNWDYYIGATTVKYQKSKIGTTTSVKWWTRSPDITGYMGILAGPAGEYLDDLGYKLPFCPCFAW